MAGLKAMLEHVGGVGSIIECIEHHNDAPLKLVLKSATEEIGGLRKTLSDLIFTATALWDKVKNIKDTETMVVTHPIIEEAKVALAGDSVGWVPQQYQVFGQIHGSQLIVETKCTLCGEGDKNTIWTTIEKYCICDGCVSLMHEGIQLIKALER